MSLSSQAEKIKVAFKTHGITIPVTDEMYEQFAKFYKFLMDYNRKLNMTRLTTFDDVVLKHFVDCVYVAQMMDLPTPLIDMGTGPGFPGVPLKIVRPDLRIILVEGVQKRVEFLKALRDHLGLKGLDIIGRNLDPKMSYPVQGVITRAVELSKSTLGNAINCVQTGGLVILMKTPDINPEIEEAVEAFKGQYEIVKNQDYSLGNTTHMRKLLVFKKLPKANPV